jgi:hypothetical protein
MDKDWHVIMVSKTGKIFNYYCTCPLKGTAINEAKQAIIYGGMCKEEYQIQVVMEVEKEEL